MIYQAETSRAEYAYFCRCDKCGKELRACCNVKDGLLELIAETRWSVDERERVLCPTCKRKEENETQ